MQFLSKSIFKYLAFVTILFFVSCQDDSSVFVPDDSMAVPGNNIFGIVEDENGSAIENAVVNFNGNEILTDQFGVYQFKNVSLDTRHNFISITKTGYFEGARTFRTNKATTIQHTTQLLAKNFEYSFDGNSGGVVNEGTIALDFEANSIKVEASGADYNGMVRVAVKYLDPTSSEIIRQMPGDMSAIDANDVYSTLSSFGMAFVELQGTDGEKLQIKEGKKATMTGTIPQDRVSKAPSTIKMWYFDDAAGVWVEDGTATLAGNTYVGEVSHFTCWNYDGDAPTIILCGRVIDQNGDPVAGVHVWVATPAFFAVGHGNTGGDGRFCGAVTKDELLTLEIQGVIGCPNPIHLGDIGPFSTDTDLGDIAITLNADETVRVFGTALNCDGDPVTNGMARLYSTSTQITDGTFDISIHVCDASETFGFKVIDLDEQTIGDNLSVTGPGPHDLGMLNACAQEVNYMEMISNSLGTNYTGFDETFVYRDSVIAGLSSKNCFGYYDDANQGSASLSFTYQDIDDMGYEIGSFAITGGNYFDGTNGTQASYQIASGTVEVTEHNATLGYIKGSYDVILSDPSGNDVDLSGKFKLSAN